MSRVSLLVSSPELVQGFSPAVNYKRSLMIELLISKEMLQYSQSKAIELGILKNSILCGEGNIVGFLGECLTYNFLGGKLVNTYDCDLILDNGLKIDVKSKKTSVTPISSYTCTINAANIKQLCDIYIFTRIHKNFQKGWLLGWLNKDDFYKNAIFIKKGTYDPSNDFIRKADSYNILINKLNDITLLKK